MAKHQKRYSGLYTFPDYTKHNFILHMKEMFKYVTPRHFGDQPLGVWPVSLLENGVEKFAKDKGVKLHAVKKFKSFNRENIIDYIKEGLEKDLPVAMLIGTGGSSDVTITKPNGDEFTGNSFKLHWVTITELEIDESQNYEKVKVSSWGGWGEVDLDDYIQNEPLYQGLLYFE
ncbi:hypothetical protein ACOAOT_14860 [Lacrimispora sp. AGF001]|uniref:hypothetical protein n=1 Tax=Lacrimispora sp. AGF001 TaxID=3401631 RepID=UPI003B42AFD8